MAITLTPTQMLLLELLISNAIRAAMNEVASLTPDEIEARIKFEQKRKDELLARLHG